MKEYNKIALVFGASCLFILVAMYIEKIRVGKNINITDSVLFTVVRLIVMFAKSSSKIVFLT